VESSVDRVGIWYADVRLRIVGIRVTFEAMFCKDLGDLSYTYSRKRSGPSAEPCGTPNKRWQSSDSRLSVSVDEFWH